MLSQKLKAKLALIEQVKPLAMEIGSLVPNFESQVNRIPEMIRLEAPAAMMENEVGMVDRRVEVVYKAAKALVALIENAKEE